MARTFVCLGRPGPIDWSTYVRESMYMRVRPWPPPSRLQPLDPRLSSCVCVSMNALFRHTCTSSTRCGWVWGGALLDRCNIVASHTLGTASCQGMATWFRAAAEHGHVVATRWLAYCRENAIGVERDNAQAVALYSHAAEQGDGYAMQKLGGFHQRGFAVPGGKDLLTAFAMYTRASAHGRRKTAHRALSASSQPSRPSRSWRSASPTAADATSRTTAPSRRTSACRPRRRPSSLRPRTSARRAPAWAGPWTGACGVDDASQAHWGHSGHPHPVPSQPHPFLCFSGPVPSRPSACDHLLPVSAPPPSRFRPSSGPFPPLLPTISAPPSRCFRHSPWRFHLLP